MTKFCRCLKLSRDLLPKPRPDGPRGRSDSCETGTPTCGFWTGCTVGCIGGLIIKSPMGEATIPGFNAGLGDFSACTNKLLYCSISDLVRVPDSAAEALPESSDITLILCKYAAMMST